MNVLHKRVLFLVSEERRISAELILELIQVERTMLYAEMGFPNMFEYLKKGCGYSESAAYRRMAAMKLQKQIPAVAEKIKSGELSLTNAAKLSSVLYAAKKQKIDLPKAELFQAALSSPTREAEKKFAEIVLPLGLEIKTKRDDFRELIESVKAAHSHKMPGMSDDDLFKFLLEKEAARLKTQGNTGRGKSETLTRYIPAQVKREVEDRDPTCTYRDPKTGRRCEGTHFLQFHHKTAFAHGGKTNAQNLTRHCHAHNQLEARKAGLGFYPHQN